MDRTKIYVMHSSHLDLYWIGAQEDCLAKGAFIIDNALSKAQEDPQFHFLIETSRFLEYYIEKYPHRLKALKEVFATGQFEIGACYTDRLENHVDGESLIRNANYGKKITKRILGIETDIACHPDLPGFAEQTPQIYKKSGVRYYLSARGFKYGARFIWQGLDNSSIVMYNVPGHYAYYDMEDVISKIEEAKKWIKSDYVLLGCSAGDMGPAGTFIVKENGKGVRYNLAEFLKIMQKRHPEIQFEIVNVKQILDGMDTTDLEINKGESPSRWGHHGSAMNVEFYMLDKKVSAALLDAEKLSTICEIIGVPIEYSVTRHPLMHKGGAGGMRRYFELGINPSTVKEWIEFGWRLQIITQDHNFGGIDGAQSEFDRMIYKKAALNIANDIKQLSLQAILSKMNIDSESIAVFNTLNWKRSQMVSFYKPELNETCSYAAVDESGNMTPVYKTGDNWTFLAHDVPSMGFKTFRIEKIKVDGSTSAEVTDLNGTLTVQNDFYRIVIDKATGELISFIDLETMHDWADKCGALIIEALEDTSFGGSERIVDKKLLDISSRNTRYVHICELIPLWTKLEIISEICDVKVRLLLTIYNTHKQMDVKVIINWPGIPDMQLKMGLCRRNLNSKITYGVPYGAQDFGKYMKGMSFEFGNDEISPDIFMRYREVQGWFAVEQDGCGLLIASNHSAYDFKPDGISVMLLRDVRNGGENDVRFSNFGLLEYEFCFTSYRGLWNKTEAYRMAWERQFPLILTFGTKQNGTSLNSYSFVSTEEKGILTVLGKSELQDDAYILRLFNPTSEEKTFTLTLNMPVQVSNCINLDETPCVDPRDRLLGYEIKTIKLEKDSE